MVTAAIRCMGFKGLPGESVPRSATHHYSAAQAGPLERRPGDDGRRTRSWTRAARWTNGWRSSPFGPRPWLRSTCSPITLTKWRWFFEEEP